MVMAETKKGAFLNPKTIRVIKTIAIIIAVIVGLQLAANAVFSGLLGAGSSADDGIFPGAVHTVKAADGSGQVALYGLAGGGPVHFVPDGTEFKLGTVVHFPDNEPRVKVPYENEEYYINRKDVAGETAASIAEREATAAATSRELNTNHFIGWVFVVLFIAGCIMYRKMVTKKIIQRFAAYYREKRAQFPWLENWIAENTDPEPPRVAAEIKSAGILPLIIFAALSIAVYVILRVIHVTPMTTRSLIQGAIMAGIFIVIFIIALRSVDPSSAQNGRLYGTAWSELWLECPSCGCPHAWTLLDNQFIVQGKTTKTTITEKWKENEDGKREFGSTERKVKKQVSWYGRQICNFKCDNCGHTLHKDEDQTWNFFPGDDSVIVYNPPVRAWEPEETEEKKA
jgi:hypothetical protein